MQGGRVRARPVDNFRRLPIVRSDVGVAYEEEISDGVSQTTKKAKVDLPVPAVSDVADYAAFTPATFKAPDAYFRRHVPSEDADATEYDLEFEDELWLNRHARYGTAADASMRVTPATLERIIDLLERISGERNKGGAITSSEAVSLIPPRLGGSISLPRAIAGNVSGLNKLIEDVYSYWNVKRTKLKKPLLRRFWPLTAVGDSDPYHTFRQHERDRYKLRRTRRNDAESLDKVSRLVTDLRSARDILDCVRTREQLKSEVTLVSQDWFEQALHDATDTTGVPRVPTTLNRPRIADRIPKRARMHAYAVPQMQRGGYDDMDEGGDVEYAPKTANKKDKRPKPTRPSVAGDASNTGAAAVTDKRQKVAGSSGPKKMKPPPKVEGGQPGSTVPPPVRPAVPPQLIYKEGYINANAHGMGHMFAHGYPGLKLGAWALPRTIPPNYLFDAYYDHEDPLGLGAALGLRTGIHTTPASVDASFRGDSFPVLPSKAGHFPYETAYTRPADDDMYISDLTVQRSMLIQRASAGTVVAGANWEEGSGSGLVPGVGCNTHTDGRAWENAGAHTQSCVLPLEDVCSAVDMEVVADKESMPTAASSAAAPEEAMGAAHTPELRSSMVTEQDDWIARFVSACDVTRPPPLAASADAALPPPQFMLRPRLSRCGRVVYDRMRVREQAHSAAVAHSMAARTQARAKARARALACSRTYTQDAAGLDSSYVSMPSRMELTEGMGMRVDATDAHTQHVCAIGHYASTGADVFSSTRTHARAADSVYTHTARVRGMHTVYLAQSKYSAAHVHDGDADGEDAAPVHSDALALTYADVSALCADARVDVSALCDGVLDSISDKLAGAGKDAARRPRPYARGYDALQAVHACVLHEVPLPAEHGVNAAIAQQPVHVLRDAQGIPITGAHSDACVPSRVRVATADGGDGHAPARAVGTYVQSLLGFGSPGATPPDVRKFIPARVAARSCAVDDKRWEAVWGAEDSDDEEVVRTAYAAAVPRERHADVGASVRAALAACVSSALDEGQCAQLCASFAGEEAVA